MARVTVEDCIQHIPNRFELVIIAAQRAKQIASGTPLTIDRDNDKDAVVSLREIADKTINIEQIKDDLIQMYCKKNTIERIENAAMKFQHQSNSAQAAEDQIADAFRDASQNIVEPSAAEDEDSTELSFEDENIEVED